MKSTGIVRKLDQLGRIVIPKELRKVLDINERDPLEIFVDEELIILKKYHVKNACIVTGEISDENKEYAPGLVLSPKGAEIVLNMLMQETKRKI